LVSTYRHHYPTSVLRPAKESEEQRIISRLGSYNKTGYTIKEIHCDQEFKHMMNEVSDEMGVETKHASIREYVHEGERPFPI
jgi:hypothetical protein